MSRNEILIFAIHITVAVAIGLWFALRNQKGPERNRLPKGKPIVKDAGYPVQLFRRPLQPGQIIPYEKREDLRDALTLIELRDTASVTVQRGYHNATTTSFLQRIHNDTTPPTRS